MGDTLAIDIRALQRALAPHAVLRCHDAVSQPLTFGLRRPIILLPRRARDLPAEAQRAIVCHELLHVGRRDWAWILVEEAIQTAFWWHPAMLNGKPVVVRCTLSMQFRLK